LKKNPTKL